MFGPVELRRWASIKLKFVQRLVYQERFQSAMLAMVKYHNHMLKNFQVDDNLFRLYFIILFWNESGC